MPHTYTKRAPGEPITTNAERIRRYRLRQHQEGLVRVEAWLDRETYEALLMLTNHGNCMSHAVAAVCQEYAEVIAESFRK